MDIEYNVVDLVKGFVFTLFLAALGFCIWEYAEWDASRISLAVLGMRIAGAYGVVTLCIIAMAWIERRGGFAVWSREARRRGFDVIFKK